MNTLKKPLLLSTFFAGAIACGGQAEDGFNNDNTPAKDTPINLEDFVPPGSVGIKLDGTPIPRTIYTNGEDNLDDVSGTDTDVGTLRQGLIHHQTGCTDNKKVTVCYDNSGSDKWTDASQREQDSVYNAMNYIFDRGLAYFVEENCQLGSSPETDIVMRRDLSTSFCNSESEFCELSNAVPIQGDAPFGLHATTLIYSHPEAVAQRAEYSSRNDCDSMTGLQKIFCIVAKNVQKEALKDNIQNYTMLRSYGVAMGLVAPTGTQGPWSPGETSGCRGTQFDPDGNDTNGVTGTAMTICGHRTGDDRDTDDYNKTGSKKFTVGERNELAACIPNNTGPGF